MHPSGCQNSTSNGCTAAKLFQTQCFGPARSPLDFHRLGSQWHSSRQPHCPRLVAECSSRLPSSRLAATYRTPSLLVATSAINRVRYSSRSSISRQMWALASSMSKISLSVWASTSLVLLVLRRLQLVLQYHSAQPSKMAVQQEYHAIITGADFPSLLQIHYLQLHL